MSAVQEELEALKGADGLLHAETVVEWARRHPKSALHAEFEWDTDKAAREHWLWQARRLIALHIVTETGERKTVSLSIDRTKGGGYRAIADVARSKDLRQVLLLDALAELRRAQAKYAAFKELSRVWVEIERADKKHGSGGGKKAA